MCEEGRSGKEDGSVSLTLLRDERFIFILLKSIEREEREDGTKHFVQCLERRRARETWFRDVSSALSQHKRGK